MTVLADNGADIVEFLHKPTDTDFLWKPRGGIREPAKQVSTIPSALGNNLDWYEGGWHECLPGGGSVSTSMTAVAFEGRERVTRIAPDGSVS